MPTFKSQDILLKILLLPSVKPWVVWPLALILARQHPAEQIVIGPSPQPPTYLFDSLLHSSSPWRNLG